MRLPEAKVKAAIQRSEEEVRLTALRFFTDSPTDDRTVMPLVIQAVEFYGIEAAFRVLREADNLPQTDSTAEWLVGQLHRADLDPRDVHDDNYCSAISLILCDLGSDLLPRWYDRIHQAPLFSNQLKRRLADGMTASSWSWQDVWARFLSCVDELSRKTKWSSAEHIRIHRLGELLARHPRAERKILSLLQRKLPNITPDLAGWIDQDVVRIAGLMRLEAAIPQIIERAHLADENTADNCGQALGRIGTDQVVTAIASDWECGDFDFRMIMCEALKMVHSDLCVATCLRFLHEERDAETRVELGYALLNHFSFDAIEPIRQLVQGDLEHLDPEEAGLRFLLVVVAMIMDVRFPEFDTWQRQAIAADWGAYGLEVSRISENLGE